ncbi:MAG: sulfotransferase [Mariniblastus sp.]|nr:sulfotransferase [Mariniblastus sp.]
MSLSLYDRARRKAWHLADRARLRWFAEQYQRWPCESPKRLVVGCESSGTTIIAKSLFGKGRLRFLVEGEQSWVWDARSKIYQGQATFRDYPHLRLFDNWKVPGFAPVLPQLREVYPNCRAIYVVRDPRDVIASAFRTFRIKDRAGFADVPWVKADWLGIEETDPIARMAMRWKIYLERSLKVDQVHYMRYEDFCDHKVATIKELAEYLEIPVDLKFVGSICNQQASNSRARSYAPQGPNSWQHLEALEPEDIDRVKQICEPFFTQWGYA